MASSVSPPPSPPGGLPSGADAASPNADLRRGLLLRLLILGWVAIGLFAVSYAAVGLRVLPWVELAFFVAVGVSILWVKQGRAKVQSVALLQAFSIFGVIAINTLVLGGFVASGGFAIWSYLPPVAAMFLLHGRARVVLNVCTGVFLVGVLLSERFLTPIETIPPAWLGYFFFLNVSCTIVVVVGSLAYFHGRLLAERRALAASERHLRLTLEQMPAAIAMKDESGRYVFVNRSFEETFAVSAERIFREGDGVWSPEDARRLRAAESAVVGEDEPVSAEETLTLRDEHRLLRSSRLRLSGSDGHRFLVWVAEDVTDRVRAEQAGQNERHLQALGTLAGGIAHDFNNLLMTVQGNLELLAGESEPARAAARRDTAQRAVERARELTRQILTFARGGAPSLAPTALAGLLEESASFALVGTSTRLVLQVPPELPPAAADAVQLGRVIHNLVLNAAQAMPEGGVVRVTASVAPPDELPPELVAGRPYLRITIADQGHGIEPSVLRRVLDPFFTTRAGGSGLGLTTSHSIVRQHGGALAIRSAPGAGTTVTLWLPTARASTASLPPGLATAAPVGPARILVMDDDPNVREVLVAMLTSRGHTVEECTDGGEALERYAAARAAGTPFDVVFLDLTVPGGMGGMEAAGHLLALDPGAALVAASGYAEDAVQGELRRRGFRASLVKPFTIAQAQAAVARALAGRPATD